MSDSFTAFHDSLSRMFSRSCSMKQVRTRFMWGMNRFLVFPEQNSDENWSNSVIHQINSNYLGFCLNCIAFKSIFLINAEKAWLFVAHKTQLDTDAKRNKPIPSVANDVYCVLGGFVSDENHINQHNHLKSYYYGWFGLILQFSSETGLPREH